MQIVGFLMRRLISKLSLGLKPKHPFTFCDTCTLNTGCAVSIFYVETFAFLVYCLFQPPGPGNSQIQGNNTHLFTLRQDLNFCMSFISAIDFNKSSFFWQVLLIVSTKMSNDFCLKVNDKFELSTRNKAMAGNCINHNQISR